MSLLFVSSPSFESHPKLSPSFMSINLALFCIALYMLCDLSLIHICRNLCKSLGCQGHDFFIDHYTFFIRIWSIGISRLKIPEI